MPARELEWDTPTADPRHPNRPGTTAGAELVVDRSDCAAACDQGSDTHPLAREAPVGTVVVAASESAASPSRVLSRVVSRVTVPSRASGGSAKGASAGMPSTPRWGSTADLERLGTLVLLLRSPPAVVWQAGDAEAKRASRRRSPAQSPNLVCFRARSCGQAFRCCRTFASTIVTGDEYGVLRWALPDGRLRQEDQ